MMATRPRPTEQPYLAGWLAFWGALRRYHRYEVQGIEHLTTGRPVLIVGYHGRPLAHDLCMLTVEVFERLGYLPHGVAHGGFEHIPRGPRILGELGFVTADSGSLSAAIERGEHILVAPGGTREGCRPFWRRYHVDWGPRYGYLQLARRYGLPVVPVAASGSDSAYLQLVDGHRWGRKLRLPARLPLVVSVGLGGLWPLAAPLPVKVRQWIGAPIDVGRQGDGLDDDSDALAALHRDVQHALQRGLDGARAR